MDPVDATGRGVATDAGPMALAALVALPGTGVAAEGGVAAESFESWQLLWKGEICIYPPRSSNSEHQDVNHGGLDPTPLHAAKPPTFAKQPKNDA